MLETWWTWSRNLFTGCRKLLQSWCQYSNTYNFEEYSLNNINNRTQIEVCSTFNLIYNNVSYINNEVIKIKNSVNQISTNKKDNAKKINSKLYNVNTNTYENIIYNKKKIAIDLFDKLDSSIMTISENIIRNYLVKNVVYKLDNRIIEIQINQNNILVSFHRIAKQFDDMNKLIDRKGYKNNSICYSLIVEDNTSCDYAIKIIKDMYDYFVNPKESLSDKLFNILKFKITTISDSITFHNTNKGLMFKDRRNFVLLSKTNYGIYVRVLKVENTDNILNIVTRKNYEPLCLSYKVKEESDIDVILPYINSSYDLNKINPYDLKEEFYKYYVTT